MIKKNEIKIKASNKRLFSEISSQNVLPTTNVANVVVSSVGKNKIDDETDGKLKFARINSFDRASNINDGKNAFYGKIVTTMLQLPSSNSNSNNSNVISSVIIGANLAKKFQAQKDKTILE